MTSVFVETQALLHLISGVFPLVHEAHSQRTPVTCRLKPM